MSYGKKKIAMNNMSAEILRNLVSGVFKVKAEKVVLSGELMEKFELQQYNNSGNLFSNYVKVIVWAFNPKEGFVKVNGSYNYSSQDANGSRHKEYGVNFEDCAKHTEAIFFVAYTHEKGWQEGRRDWDYESYKLYKATNFKEYFEKIEKKDIDRWEQWINQ